MHRAHIDVEIFVIGHAVEHFLVDCGNVCKRFRCRLLAEYHLLAKDAGGVREKLKIIVIFYRVMGDLELTTRRQEQCKCELLFYLGWNRRLVLKQQHHDHREYSRKSDCQQSSPIPPFHNVHYNGFASNYLR